MSNSKDAVRKVLDQVKADKRTSLTAPEGKLVCDAYGIAVPKEGVAKSAGEAGKMASSMGFPVVMKIVSPDILHKTEAGGVIVGLKTAEDAEKAYETILSNARKYKSDAKIEGVQVQQMLAGGTEVIVGSITDASFGKLVAFGLGGVLVEVLKDITFRLAPATKQDALSMLDGIQAHEILKGVRGGEPVNRDGARRCHRQGLAARHRFPRDRRARSQPGVRHGQGRDRGRRPHRRRLRLRAQAEAAPDRRDRRGHEPHHAAEGGCRGRRFGRRRQDRQFRDEEPHQRRLQGRHLPDPSQGRRDPRLQGL